MIILILSMLTLISLVDIVFLRIPNLLNMLLFLNAICYIIWYDAGGNLLGSVIGVLLFILAYVITKAGIGEGDVKLIASLGICVGYPNVLLLILLSSMLSIMCFLINKKRKAQVLPFAPFLSIISIIMILQSSSF